MTIVAWHANPFSGEDTQILRELADGLTTADIAELHSLTRHAIQQRIGRMTVKINARTREQLLATALRREWIR